MGDNTRLWSTQLRADQNEKMKQIVEEEELSKSELMKRAVDTHLEERNSNDLTAVEDAVLEGAVVSSIGVIAVTAAVALSLLPWQFLQLAGVMAVTAVVTVLIVQQRVLRGDQ